MGVGNYGCIRVKVRVGYTHGANWQACGTAADNAYNTQTSFITLQVYYIAKGKVKPANKAYSSVRNDYQLHLDSG